MAMYSIRDLGRREILMMSHHRMTVGRLVSMTALANLAAVGMLLPRPRR
jgi:hypothetical protein